MQEKENSGIVIAAMIAATAGILSIGLLNLLGEASAPIKDFLAFSEGMGSLSGKLVLSYTLAALVFLALFRIKALSRQSLILWVWVLAGATLIGSLLVYTPFIELLLE